MFWRDAGTVKPAILRLPFSVHDNVDHPISLYAATKKANELMAHAYSDLYALPATRLGPPRHGNVHLRESDQRRRTNQGICDAISPASRNPRHCNRRRGFLGSHLCERLLKNGANVICVDNFFTGTRRNIDRIIDHHRFDLIRHDVTFSLYIEADQIYNLACPTSPIHYQHDPVPTKTSVHGAINMLGLAKRLRAKILQASTSEIYGVTSTI
jgi:nucleoside-diphosphate-sugar epimerase